MNTRIEPIWPIILILSLSISCNESSSPGLSGKVSAEPGSENISPKKEIYVMTYAQRSGKRLFDSYCVICHGQNGQGDGFNSYNLVPRPRDLTDTAYVEKLSDTRMSEVITQGGIGAGKSILMPAYGSTLTSSQIDDLVAYIRYLGRQNKND